jgi:hypothetical protein
MCRATQPFQASSRRSFHLLSLPRSAPNLAVETDGGRVASSDRIPESVTIVVVPSTKLNRGFPALFVAVQALLIMVRLRIGTSIGIIVYPVAMLGFGIDTLVARPPSAPHKSRRPRCAFWKCFASL